MRRRHFIGLGPGLAGVCLPALAAGRLAEEIRAFATLDAAHPPAPGGIVFVGSSSIRGWRTLVGDFPGYPVINRGFGGSTLPDVNEYFDRLVAALKPRAVVLYAGDNDLAGGRTVDQVEGDFREFARRMAESLPEARAAFVAIKPSPAREAWLAAQREANRRIREWIGGHPRWGYVDVFTPMLDSRGRPEPLYFGRDRLHLNANGYAVWRREIGAWLKEIRFPVSGPGGAGAARP
ncbi:MAG: GDSL-type esterase/lipase family protein [Verrucomicrobiota bacterium]